MKDSEKTLREPILNKDKWWDVLSRLINVLRINIFMISPEGEIILPPADNRFGAGLLTRSDMGFELIRNPREFLKKFSPHGERYQELVNDFGLCCFAIPINANSSRGTLAYFVLGPVILNKKKSRQEYAEEARRAGIEEEDWIDELNAIRVVSHIMLNSILDLLYEIARDNVELTIKEMELSSLKDEQIQPADKLREFAREVYSTVHMDELYATLLDVALTMTKTQGGSIMILDPQSQTLQIKAARGLKFSGRKDKKIQLGQGIAGIAAQENSPFVIEGQKANNRIKKLLKRPEIKQSLIMPLTAKDKGVYGVLNLHTEDGDAQIKGNLDNLKYLSRLLATVF